MHPLEVHQGEKLLAGDSHWVQFRRQLGRQITRGRACTHQATTRSPLPLYVVHQNLVPPFTQFLIIQLMSLAYSSTAICERVSLSRPKSDEAFTKILLPPLTSILCNQILSICNFHQSLMQVSPEIGESPSLPPKDDVALTRSRC